MDKNEQEWHDRILKGFEAARAWEVRIAAPDRIEPGSSLAVDDKGLVSDPVRSAAWSGLLSAVDHLALMADLPGDDGLNMRPTSMYTPARAALLGASQAVWVLSGNRTARRARALAIAEDDCSQHRKFLWDYAKDDFVQANFSREFMDGITSRIDTLTAEITRIRELRKSLPRIGSDATTMMREAAEHLATGGSAVDHGVRLALAYEWRVASAATHGRSWPALERRAEKAETPGGHMLSFTTSAQELGRSVGAAVMMTSEAWRLWDLRRVKHV